MILGKLGSPNKEKKMDNIGYCEGIFSGNSSEKFACVNES
jgi:hypothetical protein